MREGTDRSLKRLLVIRNPAAGQRRERRYRRAMALIERRARFDVAETRGPGDATRIAEEADPARYDAVVAAGGDGTVNEAVNGLAGRPLPLGVIPLGTANVLAHEIGVGSSIDRAVAAILAGRPQPIALARADGRYGCLMVSAGYDARAMTRVRPALKRLFGEGAYYVAATEELLARRRTMLSVEADGRRYEASTVIVANGRLYGGRYVCAPDADLTVAEFRVVMLQRTGLWNVARYGLALIRGALPRLPDVRTVAASQVRILGPAGEPYQSDGDLLGTIPVTVVAVPDAVEILVPADSRGTAIPAAAAAAPGTPGRSAH